MSIMLKPTIRTLRSFVVDGAIYHVVLQHCWVDGEEHGCVTMINDHGTTMMGRAVPPAIDQIATLPLREMVGTIFGVIPEQITEDPPSRRKINRWTLWNPVYQKFCSVKAWVAASGYYDLTFFTPEALVTDQKNTYLTVTIAHHIKETINRLLHDPLLIFEDLAPASTRRQSDLSCRCALNLVYHFPVLSQIDGQQRPSVVLTPAGPEVELTVLHAGRLARSFSSLVPWDDLHQTLRQIADHLGIVCILPFVTGKHLYFPITSQTMFQRGIEVARYTFTSHQRALAIDPPSVGIVLDPPTKDLLRFWMEDPITALTEATFTGTTSW